jgi:hypothetical protein
MHPDTPERFRLFYVDDSGSPTSGIVVYSFFRTTKIVNSDLSAGTRGSIRDD